MSLSEVPAIPFLLIIEADFSIINLLVRSALFMLKYYNAKINHSVYFAKCFISLYCKIVWRHNLKVMGSTNPHLAEPIDIEKDIKDSFLIHFFKEKAFANIRVQRLAYHRIILVTSGIGTLKIDEHIFKISSAELFLIAKGQVIAFQQGAEFTGYELSFGDCFWERAPQSANNCKAVLFNNASANQSLQLTANDFQELNVLFQSLLGEYNKNAYINKLDAMAAYLKIIMIKIANVNIAISNAFESHENKIYRQFISLINEHYQTSHEVTDYARLLGISVRKLTDVSKNSSGRGAKELINAHLITEAKRSLQFSARPIKEIAFELNFSSAEQFSHFFKKNVQISPKEYRTHFMIIGS
ncbi:helix-turn-helix domain-containing protein [Pedobacter hiemivivus]|uniref:Helix-turn-helix domain-containing protein n=2 Tax=Pedobacter hiemivivus TaxID=2530454 RepID=A0A4U1GIJ5_9SPHI|nr:helix-turn-helix domain-containing protein [Pedobacter hiemivivus]